MPWVCLFFREKHAYIQKQPKETHIHTKKRVEPRPLPRLLRPTRLRFNAVSSAPAGPALLRLVSHAHAHAHADRLDRKPAPALPKTTHVAATRLRLGRRTAHEFPAPQL